MNFEDYEGFEHYRGSYDTGAVAFDLLSEAFSDFVTRETDEAYVKQLLPEDLVDLSDVYKDDIGDEIAGLPHPALSLNAPGMSRDTFDSLVFGVGCGFYWIREWLGHGDYGSPPLHSSYLEWAHEFADHPAVADSTIRDQAEEFARGVLHVNDIKEHDRRAVYDLVRLYGCARCDMLSLITDMAFQDGMLTMYPSTKFQTYPLANVPLPPLSSAPFDRVIVVPSLRDMCKARVPVSFAEASPASEKYGITFSDDISFHPDVALDRVVAEHDSQWFVDRFGYGFKRGSIGAVNQGCGRLSDDVDNALVVNTLDEVEFRTRRERMGDWYNFIGFNVNLFADRTLYYRLHPALVGHPGFVTNVFCTAVGRAAYFGARRVIFSFRGDYVLKSAKLGISKTTTNLVDVSQSFADPALIQRDFPKGLCRGPIDRSASAKSRLKANQYDTWNCGTESIMYSRRTTSEQEYEWKKKLVVRLGDNRVKRSAASRVRIDVGTSLGLVLYDRGMKAKTYPHFPRCSVPIYPDGKSRRTFDKYGEEMLDSSSEDESESDDEVNPMEIDEDNDHQQDDEQA